MSMLLDVLPPSPRDDVRKYLKGHPFKTHTDVIAHLHLDTDHAIDEKVAEALRTRRFGDLPGYSSTRVRALMQQQPAEPSPSSAASAKPENSPNGEVLRAPQRVCATPERFQPRGRGRDRQSGRRTPGSGSQQSSRQGSRRSSPRASRVPQDLPGGCFHCGEKDHRRDGRKAFSDYNERKGIKKGTKLPDEYEGALERLKKTQATKIVHAVDEPASQASAAPSGDN